MKRTMSGRIWLMAAVVCLCACEGVRADTRPNPYESIVERNPFGLKPPPPPAPPEDPSSKTPPAPPATVEVTGITSILSSKRALLEIVPGPGKPMIKPILAEGERVDSVEVVSINVEKNEVVVKNGGVITNLTFKVAKSTPAPAGGGAVPAPVPGSVPPPVAPQTAYNNTYGSGNRAVMMGGGAPVAPPAAAAGAAPNAATHDGFRSIPSRTLRANQQQTMSAEESVLQVEQNRLLNNQLRQAGARIPPLPPTVITPNPEGIGGVDDGQGYQNQPATSGGRPGWQPRRLNLPPPPGLPQ